MYSIVYSIVYIRFSLSLYYIRSYGAPGWPAPTCEVCNITSYSEGLGPSVVHLPGGVFSITPPGGMRGRKSGGHLIEVPPKNLKHTLLWIQNLDALIPETSTFIHTKPAYAQDRFLTYDTNATVHFLQPQASVPTVS